ncbi:hypothetical protein ABB37_04102 [Leptomonas pyrrhocoris]|uniref:ESF1 RRM domain-containing protein n=1 Tax=Leptomonas pyrrhocoris TaxID=157538 RepID=A0A0N0VFY1_LEPPY|nr:hypothetical protein ABB37_04102 [Leptomonas pyrrhocoris]KPA81844.1 hypothetical protein ABB37_04102 [Leptomonas pyrrhocoris]|eukprot:XP_015660283.1 hypothetical protein ABB37_04102 [Leptomonas pyrrhocoris]
MKTLQSSSRGRGGGSNYRGRGSSGGGRGRSVSSGHGRGRDNGDRRFAARFTDPRFQVSAQAGRQSHRRHRDTAEKSAEQDPRFAKYFAPSDHDGAMEEATEEDDEENEEVSQHTSSDEDVDVEEVGSLPLEEEAALDDEVNAWAPDEVEFIEARRRVAIVNCDWDHVRAVDLYAILFHALPLGGQLHEVCVYMSEWGKKMIALEKTHGPDLWVKPGEADATASAEGEDGAPAEGEAEMPAAVELPEEVSDDEISEPRSDGWTDDNPDMLHEQGEDGEFFSDGKFRRYEMDRMKYYYAVASFDSADTAAAVYNELDGMDIEASGVVLDLRYIDDDETFAQPVSRADHIPANFRPLASFKMSAMSQSKFRISWDQDDVFRHQSVQDSFTGTTEEDDLAAYLAPADSDADDDGGPADPAKRTREKRDIRRKYAALLEEVGGIPDKLEEEEEEKDAHGATASAVDGLDDGSDDDSLNRFSDVEMQEDEEEEEDDGDDGEVTGNMETTFDLDADTKAAGLQHDTRLKQKLQSADLATQAAVKYKLRRKEMKKSKKDMLRQERETEKAAQADHQAENRQKLKELMGTDDDGSAKASGKERRKTHAKQVKERLAEERAAKKKMRAASQLGVTLQVQHVRREQEAQKAAEQIDDRFKSKLLSDPRFHLEVAQKDKRVTEDVAQLASTVAKARQGKRERAEDAKPANSQNSMKDTLDFFLAKKKARK